MLDELKQEVNNHPKPLMYGKLQKLVELTCRITAVWCSFFEFCEVCIYSYSSRDFKRRLKLEVGFWSFLFAREKSRYQKAEEF